MKSLEEYITPPDQTRGREQVLRVHIATLELRSLRYAKRQLRAGALSPS